jgi:type IV fimbrial biogenesis protein FimT
MVRVKQHALSAVGPTMPHRASGFTLTELVTAMAVVAILAMIAVPSFSNLIASQRAKTFGSELFTTLLKTRSYAIQRNASATLSPLSGNWANGWQIIDPASSTTVLEQRDAASGVTVTGPGSVTFNSSGRVKSGSSTNFVVTTTSGSTMNYQCVSLDPGGRPYMVAAVSC